MRQITIFLSLICFIITGIDAFLNLFNATQSTHFPAPVILGVYLLFFIDVILVGIYIIRQELSMRQRLKQPHNEDITYRDLIKARSATARPYRREIHLRYAMFLSIVVIALLGHALALFIDTSSTNSFTRINDMVYQISLPAFPAILFLYASFSKVAFLQHFE
ncbi:MAG: hypothetical protein H0V70_02060 [Ktedonobacteraceae bacterium]|nr:hypothetical protein [Ktedonobacteraceae bacterium]